MCFEMFDVQNLGGKLVVRLTGKNKGWRHYAANLEQ